MNSECVEMLETGNDSEFSAIPAIYRAPEQRLRGAASLMLGTPEPSIGEYFSRIQIVARWGLDNDALEPYAREVFLLTDKLAEHQGEMALTFEKGSQQALAEAEGELDDYIVLNLGYIAGMLVHEAGPTARGSFTFPTLRHGMGIAVYSPLRIEADLVGLPTITPTDTEGVIPVWRGTSPIINDQQQYGKYAQAHAFDWVIGTEACMGVVERLDELTGRSGMLDHFRGLAAA